MPIRNKHGNYCGSLMVECSGETPGPQAHYFILSKEDHMLCVYRVNPFIGQTEEVKPLDAIKLQCISMVCEASSQRPKIPNCFVIHYEGRELFLQANDDDDMKKWIEILNNASRIIVPKSEVLGSKAREWHLGDTKQLSYKTTIAGGVVCKITQQEQHEEGSSSDEESEDVNERSTPAYLVPCFKSGFCVKQGAVRKNWKRRFFVLHDQGVSYYKTETNRAPIKTIAKKDILTAQKSNRTGPHCDNLFEIATEKRTFYVQTDTPEEMGMWIEAIGQLIYNSPEQMKFLRDNATNRHIEEGKQPVPTGTRSVWIKQDGKTTKSKKKTWAFHW